MENLMNPAVEINSTTGINDPQVDTGGTTAVLEAPVATPSTGRKPSKKKGRGKGVGQIAPTSERAEVTAANPNSVAALDAIMDSGQRLDDPNIPAPVRAIAVEAAMAILISVGLGQKSGGAGPMLRQVIKIELAKDGNPVSKTTITRARLIECMSRADFQTSALATLDAYLTGNLDKHKLKMENLSEATLDARKGNSALARQWLTAGTHKSYIDSLNGVWEMGDQCHFDSISMPLDRALAVAFGSNITASELFRAKTRSMSKSAK